MCARLCTRHWGEKGVLKENNFTSRVIALKGTENQAENMWPIRKVSQGLKSSLGTKQSKGSLEFPDIENLLDLTKIVYIIEVRD